MSYGARPGRSRVIALGLLGASLATIGFSLASLALPSNVPLPNRPDPLTFLIVCGLFVSFPLVGTIVAVKRPENPLGWLFLVLGLLFNVTFFSTDYIARATIGGWPLPGVTFVAMLNVVAFPVIVGLGFAWIPLLFPTGRLPSSRWRWVARTVAVVMVAGTAATAMHPGSLVGIEGVLENPLAAPPAIAPLQAALTDAYLPVMAVLGIACVGSLGGRFRGAGTIEREQLKWFILATAAFLLTLVAAFATESDAVFMLSIVAATAIPVAAGIAILRYRLFEIDRVISRTVSWAIVSVAVLAVFGGGVIALQTLLDRFVQGGTLAVAASTLAAFAVFQPLRVRIQRAVDRRFNRTRFDHESTAAAFADRMRGQVDLGGLEHDLGQVVGQALHPRTATIWLRREREAA